MIKLITPPGMLLTVALLAIYSAYAFLVGRVEGSAALLAGGALGAVACVGTALLKRWSQYLVYAMTVGFIVKLGSSVYDGVVSGYFDFQFDSRQQALRSLAPAASMALLSILCCWLVYRHFNRRAGSQRLATARPE